MQRLIIEIESPAKAKELESVLQALTFVKRVITEESDNGTGDEEHEEMKATIVGRKNPAIAKYLE